MHVNAYAYIHDCEFCNCGMYFGVHSNVNIICRGFGITNGELNDAHTIMLVITCTHILQLLYCLILACSQLSFDAPSRIIIHSKIVRLEC